MDCGYSLVVGPGDRAAETVLSELRDELPDVLPEAYENIDPEFEVSDGKVRWTTGWPTQIAVEITVRVPAIDVRGEWAVMIHEQEGGGMGIARLYAWFDGGWALVEERYGAKGLWADDVAAYVRSEWDIHCESVSHL